MSQMSHLVIAVLQTVPKQKESTQTDQRRLPNDRILGAAGIQNSHPKIQENRGPWFFIVFTNENKYESTIDGTMAQK